MTKPAEKSAIKGVESSATGALSFHTFRSTAQAGFTRMIPSDMLPVQVWNLHAPGFGNLYPAAIPACIPQRVPVAVPAVVPAAIPAAIQAAIPAENSACRKRALTNSDDSDEPAQSRLRMSSEESLSSSEECKHKTLNPWRAST